MPGCRMANPQGQVVAIFVVLEPLTALHRSHVQRPSSFFGGGVGGGQNLGPSQSARSPKWARDRHLSDSRCLKVRLDVRLPPNRVPLWFVHGPWRAPAMAVPGATEGRISRRDQGRTLPTPPPTLLPDLYPHPVALSVQRSNPPRPWTGCTRRPTPAS